MFDAQAIPPTLDDGLSILIKSLLPEELEFVKGQSEASFLAETHFFQGMAIRNRWGLWRNSILAQHFNKLGIYHADDMSGIILTSFYRRVHNQDIRLQEQIKFYQDFWQKQGIDPSKQT